MRTYRPYTSSIILLTLNVFFIIIAFNNQSFILYVAVSMILILYILTISVLFRYIRFDDDHFKTNFKQKVELLDCSQKGPVKKEFKYNEIQSINYHKKSRMIYTRFVLSVTLKDGRKYFIDLSMLNQNQHQDIIKHFKQNI